MPAGFGVWVLGFGVQGALPARQRRHKDRERRCGHPLSRPPARDHRSRRRRHRCSGRWTVGCIERGNGGSGGGRGGGGLGGGGGEGRGDVDGGGVVGRDGYARLARLAVGVGVRGKVELCRVRAARLARLEHLGVDVHDGAGGVEAGLDRPEHEGAVLVGRDLSAAVVRPVGPLGAISFASVTAIVGRPVGLRGRLPEVEHREGHHPAAVRRSHRAGDGEDDVRGGARGAHDAIVLERRPCEVQRALRVCVHLALLCCERACGRHEHHAHHGRQ
mmetsp:Transcript_9713/g.18886  ORF Transcript_9713/g.18886 Transcript_9713/m.18886 type:complete len:274 (-) Transcript_9713:88-909(-)